MYKITRRDGPNIVTDKGMITLSGTQYADGGKTQPVDGDTWRFMIALIIHGPALIETLREAGKQVDGWLANEIRDLLAAFQETAEKKKKT